MVLFNFIPRFFRHLFIFLSFRPFPFRWSPGSLADFGTRFHFGFGLKLRAWFEFRFHFYFRFDLWLEGFGRDAASFLFYVFLDIFGGVSGGVSRGAAHVGAATAPRRTARRLLELRRVLQTVQNSLLEIYTQKFVRYKESAL